jgi:hypothetical protein
VKGGQFVRQEFIPTELFAIFTYSETIARRRYPESFAIRPILIQRAVRAFLKGLANLAPQEYGEWFFTDNQGDRWAFRLPGHTAIAGTRLVIYMQPRELRVGVHWCAITSWFHGFFLFPMEF